MSSNPNCGTTHRSAGYVFTPKFNTVYLFVIRSLHCNVRKGSPSIARHLFLVEGEPPFHPQFAPIPPHTCPTREQLMSSMLPPHCHTRKPISMFSPPCVSTDRITDHERRQNSIQNGLHLDSGLCLRYTQISSFFVCYVYV